MSNYLAFLIIAFGAILQSTILQQFSLLGQRLDLVFVLVFCFAILRGGWSGFMWGAVGGLLLDFQSVLPFGVNAITLAIIGAVVGWSLRRLSQNYPLLPFVTMPPIAAFYALLSGLIVAVCGWPVDLSWLVARMLLPVIILSTVALPFIYVSVYTISKRTRVEIDWQANRY